MAIGFTELQKKDFDDPNLSAFNELARQIVDEVNRLAGVYGPIKLANHLDLSGNRVTNVGAPAASGDAVPKSSADKSYGPAAVQGTMEAVGNNILQTARRLNDSQQREQNTTFLNDVIGPPPTTNTSTVSVVNNGDGTSTATVSAGNYKYADQSIFSYAAANLTITNPVADTYYFAYFNYKTKTILFDGPYASASSVNTYSSNLDGRGYVAQVKFTAGGGGSGGGGGDSGKGGCFEVGTKLSVRPGNNVIDQVVPWTDWVEIETVSGIKITVAVGTLMSTFLQAEKLHEGLILEGEHGALEYVRKVTHVHRESHKIVRRVIPDGTYYGNGIKAHNSKIQP